MKYVWAFFLLFGMACNEKTADQSPVANHPTIVLDTSKVVASPRNPYVEVDVSPMDMSYLPEDYQKVPIKQSAPVARVIYSRPHKQGRSIFGNVVKYGEPWRLGANEATEIEFFQPVTIMDKNIARGRYVVYSIPEEKEWTIIFNTNLNSWGLNLDSTKDVHRFVIPAQKKNQSVEFFTMVFKSSEQGSDLVIAWDSTEARLPIIHR